jgi:SOS-response transcriptional repressor LexA
MGYRTSKGEDTRQQIYDWMKAYKAERGYMPTIKEITEGLGLWRNGVVWHLEQLRKENRIKFEDGKMARTLRFR